jgi:hypothetical protein
MADTTVERVRAIASHLEALENSQIEIYISDAKLDLDDIGFDSKYEEKLQRYLTAHLATIDVPRAISEKTEDFQVKYQGAPAVSNKNFLETTKYGQEVLRTLKKNGGPSLVLFS